MMKLSFVVAMSQNRVIGREGKLPWHLPEDLKYFKALTSGHPIVMGRKTYESIGRPLPNRRNIVITRQKDFQAPGIEIYHSVEEALTDLHGESEVFLIGGGELFNLTLPRADRLYLTLIEKDIPGDVYFPEFSPENFQEISREDHLSGDLPFSFRVYDRS